MFVPISCVIVVAVSAGPPIAKQAEREHKVRAKLRMLPHSRWVRIGFLFGSSDATDKHFEAAPPEPAPAAKLARLHRMVTQHPDLSRWLSELALEHDRYGDASNANGIRRQAVALYDNQLKRDLDNVELMTDLADTLNRMGIYEEADRWYRRALAAQPRRRETWSALGDAFIVRAQRVLNEPVTAYGTILGRAYLFALDCNCPINGSPPPTHPPGRIAAAKQFVHQAGNCRDWAVLVAPSDPVAYSDRIGTVFEYGAILRDDGPPGSLPKPFDLGQRFRAVATDTLTVARLRRDSAAAWATALSAAMTWIPEDQLKTADDKPEAFAGLSLGITQLEKQRGDPDKNPLDPLERAPEHARQQIRECLRNLDRLRVHADPATRSQACVGLCIWLMTIKDYDGAVRILYRLPPDQRTRPEVYDPLAGCLWETGRYREWIMEAKALVRHEDTAANRVRLAFACEITDDIAGAERHLLAALRADPANPKANLGMAYWLMKYGRRGDLPRVTPLLDRAQQWLDSTAFSPSSDHVDPADQQHYKQTIAELRAVWHALSGEPGRAREILEHALIGGDNNYAVDLLLALD